MASDLGNSESEDMETPVAKILEPQTKHVISTGQYTSSSHLEFTSSSDHLYNGRQMLHGYVSVLPHRYSNPNAIGSAVLIFRKCSHEGRTRSIGISLDVA